MGKWKRERWLWEGIWIFRSLRRKKKKGYKGVNKRLINFFGKKGFSLSVRNAGGGIEASKGSFLKPKLNPFLFSERYRTELILNKTSQFHLHPRI